MMTGLLTALSVMMAATLAQHLGLTEAVASVATKIAKCHMCCSFWCCMAVLLLGSFPIPESIALSIVMSYMSNYFALLLMLGQKIYNALWQRLNKP